MRKQLLGLQLSRFGLISLLLDDVHYLAPCILVMSMAVGTVFYSLVNGWSLSLSYYFAASVLLGDMYLVPEEVNGYSQTFTLLYFMWGTILLAGTIAVFANSLVTTVTRVASQERKRILKLERGTGHSQGLGSQLWTAVYQHKSKYLSVLLVLAWLGLGVVYGVGYEGWTVQHSLFFALAAISTAGCSAPLCEG